MNMLSTICVYCIVYISYSILYRVYCILYSVYTIVYIVYCILYSVYCIVYTRGRQPMARGPNVALFKSKGAKKRPPKNLGRLAKKYELLALGKRRSLIFPFLGTPTTKGWRPLVYTVYCIVYTV